jgi:hypothetical protein
VLIFALLIIAHKENKKILKIFIILLDLGKAKLYTFFNRLGKTKLKTFNFFNKRGSIMQSSDQIVIAKGIFEAAQKNDKGQMRTRFTFMGGSYNLSIPENVSMPPVGQEVTAVMYARVSSSANNGFVNCSPRPYEFKGLSEQKK